MDNLFIKKQKSKPKNQDNKTPQQNQKPNFTGNYITKSLSKIIDNSKVQNLAIKYRNKDKDIAKHMTAGTDILLTASSAYRINQSSGIKDNRKKALIYNNIISTAITLVGGYAIDSAIKKRTEKFIEKFKIINEDYSFTPREAEVFKLLVTTDNDLQTIADEMYISKRTLERHISSIYKKTQAKSRIGLLSIFNNK